MPSLTIRNTNAGGLPGIPQLSHGTIICTLHPTAHR